MDHSKVLSDYSEFSYLDDLSKYTCDTLMDAIQGMQVSVLCKDIYKYVTWENNQIAVTICFNLSGKFMHIEREVWKDLDVDFVHTVED